MKTPAPPRPELCIAEYSAVVVPVPDAAPKVFITAQGIHPTSGYDVIFHKAPTDVYPPEFSLWHVKRTSTTLDVLTPFTEIATFNLREEIKSIWVMDAAGPHEIALKILGSSLLHE
jgi:hypothetical protein